MKLTRKQLQQIINEALGTPPQLTAQQAAEEILEYGNLDMTGLTVPQLVQALNADAAQNGGRLPTKSEAKRLSQRPYLMKVFPNTNALIEQWV